MAAAPKQAAAKKPSPRKPPVAKRNGAASRKSPPPAAPKPRAKSNGAAPRKVSRAEAQKALDDMKDKPRTGNFRGIALTLPATLPASFVFDIAEMQAYEDGGTDFSVVHRLMVGLVGAAPWRAMRDKIAEDGDSLDDIGALTEEIFASVTDAYGVGLGESKASVTS